MSLAGRDLISLEDYSNEEILSLLEVAEDMAASLQPRRREQGEFAPLDRLLATCFFEPSTRTRLSFEAAMLRLGGGVLGMQDPQVSSVAKGESLADTVRVIGSYCDLLVVRHSQEGAAQEAADATPVPVINAGDGTRNHPTQTLTDLFTLRRRKGTLSGLRVGLVGDLKHGRTVHSLAPVLARLGSDVVCISPPALRMPEEILAEVARHRGQSPPELENLAAALPELEALYVTRIQRERFADPEEYHKYRGYYTVDAQMLARAPQEMLLLHPLPRVDEIAPEVDADPRAAYFEQAAGGVPVRMALIALLLGLVEPPRSRGRLGLVEPG